MEIEKFATAGIDFDQGVERCLGDQGLYCKLLVMFRDNNPYSKIKPAMDEGDVTTAFNAAHDLKGVAANLSLISLYESASAVTDALRGDGDLNLATELYPDLAESYGMVMDVLMKF